MPTKRVPSFCIRTNTAEAGVYGSGITKALVLLEDVGGKSFADLFHALVWSKLGSGGPIQLHLAPDGTAAVHGFISSCEQFPFEGSPVQVVNSMT